MLSLRDAVGPEGVRSVKDAARFGNLFPPLTLSEFINGRTASFGINVPGGITLGRAGDVELVWANIVFRSNGDWELSGMLHDHGTLVGDKFILSVSAALIEHDGQGRPIAFSCPLIIGELGGTIFGPSRNFSFKSNGNEYFVKLFWQKIAETGIDARLYATGRGGQPFTDLLDAAQEFVDRVSSSPTEQQCRDSEGNPIPCDPPPETSPDPEGG